MNLLGRNTAYSHHLLPDADFASHDDIYIRPATAVDVDLIWELHQQLSLDSIYKRYHSPRLPTKAEMAQMCSLQGRHGRAFIAMKRGTTQIVGLAYFVIYPASPETAEPALLVADAYQGQGIGKRLLARLVEQALAQGIRFFDAHVLPSNGSMIHLLHRSGQMVKSHLSYGAREMRIKLGYVV